MGLLIAALKKFDRPYEMATVLLEPKKFYLNWKKKPSSRFMAFLHFWKHRHLELNSIFLVYFLELESFIVILENLLQHNTKNPYFKL